MTRKKFVFNSIVYTTLLALLIRLFFVEVELSEGSEGGNPLLASRYFIGIIGIAVVRYSWLFHGLGDLQVYRKYQFILFAYAAIFISILPLFNNFVLFDFGSLLDEGFYSKPGQYSDDGNMTKQFLKNGLYFFGAAFFYTKFFWFFATWMLKRFFGVTYDITMNWSAGTIYFSKERHGIIDGKLHAKNTFIVIEELEGEIK